MTRISILLYYFVIAFVGIDFGCKKNDANPPTTTVPAVKDSAALIFLGGGHSKKFLALNGKDGTLKWSVTLLHPVYSSPIYSKGKVFVGCDDGHIYAFDTLGVLQWKSPFLASIYGNSPIIANDILYISTSLGAFGISTMNGSVIWSFPRLGRSTLLTYNNNVIYYNALDSLYAIDANSGARKWGYYANGNPSVPVVAFPERVYVVTVNNTVSTLNPSNGSLIWKLPDYYSTIDDCEGINVKNGNLYAVAERISILDSATGFFKINSLGYYGHIYTGFIEFGDGFSPIVTDSLLFVPYERLNAFDAFTGQFKLQLPTKPGNNFGLTIVGDIVYYTSSLSTVNLPGGGSYQAGYVYAYNFKTKTLVWEKDFQDIDFTRPSPCIVTRSGKVHRGGISQ